MQPRDDILILSCFIKALPTGCPNQTMAKEAKYSHHWREREKRNTQLICRESHRGRDKYLCSISLAEDPPQRFRLRGGRRCCPHRPGVPAPGHHPIRPQHLDGLSGPIKHRRPTSSPMTHADRHVTVHNSTRVQ